MKIKNSRKNRDSLTYSYDVMDNVVSVKDRKGQTTTYT